VALLTVTLGDIVNAALAPMIKELAFIIKGCYKRQGLRSDLFKKLISLQKDLFFIVYEGH